MKFPKSLPFIILLIVTVGFFFQFFILGKIPFPGDLLVSEYSPWKFESYLGYAPGSYPNKAQYFDVIRQLYPWKMLAIEMWKEGTIPLWNPYNFSGSPLLANNQTAAFYPINLLFFIFKPSFAWSLYIVLQPFLASLFMYLFIRSLKLSKVSALVSGIAFGFSLFMSTFLEYGNIGHSLLWLPFLLWSLESYFRDRKLRYLIFLSCSMPFVFFAGHIQIAVGVLGFTTTYLIWKVALLKKLTELAKPVIFILIGVGISAVQLLPTFELIKNSARSAHEASLINSQFLLQPEQLILFFVPDFYGNPAVRNYLLTDTYPGNAIYIGILPIIFALSTLFIKKKNEHHKFFLLLSAVFLLLFVRNPLSEFVFNLQFFASSSPSNYFFLLGFCILVVSAFGLDGIKKNIKGIFMSFGLVICLIVLLTILNKLLKIQFYEKQLILTALLFAASFISIILFAKLKKVWIGILLILVISIDLFYFFHKFNPFVPEELLYPETRIISEIKKTTGLNRFVGVGQGVIEANFATHEKVYSPDGYDPLYPRVYSDYLSSTRSDAKVEFEDQEKLNELSVRSILDRVENGSDEIVFPVDTYSLVSNFDGWKIFENNKALPRAYVLIGRAIIPAEITTYKPNTVLINTKTPGKLVLNDVNYHGWAALVDGKKVEIEKNSTFRSVNVEKPSTVEFTYAPKSFSIGLILTIISLVTLAVLSFTLIRFKNEKI